MLKQMWLLHLTICILYTLHAAQAQLGSAATISNRCDQNAINAAINDVFRYIDVALNAIDLLTTTGNVHASPDIYYLHLDAHVIFGTAQLPIGAGYSAADIATFAYFRKTYQDARKFWTGQQYTRNKVDDNGAITTDAQTFVANPYNVYINCASVSALEGDWQRVQYIGDLAPADPQARNSVAQDPRFIGRNAWFMRIPPVAPFFTLDGTGNGINGRTMDGDVCNARRVAYTTGLNTGVWTFKPITIFNLCPNYFNYPSIDTLNRSPNPFDDTQDFATRGAILLHETFHAHGFFMHDNSIRWNLDGSVIPGYRPRSMYAVNQQLGTVLTPPPYNGRGTSGFPDAYAFFAITAFYPGIAWDFFANV